MSRKDDSIFTLEVSLGLEPTQNIQALGTVRAPSPAEVTPGDSQGPRSPPHRITGTPHPGAVSTKLKPSVTETLLSGP